MHTVSSRKRFMFFRLHKLPDRNLYQVKYPMFSVHLFILASESRKKG